MSVVGEIQKLNPSALVELFMLDISPIAPALPPAQQVLRFAAMANELGGAVLWQGHSFRPFPIEARGFDLSAQGSPPRPTLRAANIGGALTALCLAHQDFVQAKLTRIRTFARFLDAANFADGNADADPTQELPQDVYRVERKAQETQAYVEWELRWPFDLQGVMLPRRVIVQGLCTWLYQSAECSWVASAGQYYDAADRPCAADDDACSKRLSGCQVRFGKKAVLPFGGFPGAGMVRQ